MKAEHEVVELIGTLHKTEKRLEELTEGEVDSVMCGDGQSLLLRKAQDGLRHSEKTKQAVILELEGVNEELEMFSFSVSHDLRAPLRHIRGFVDLLQAEAGPSLCAEHLRYLTTIATSTQRMGKLIDDLLSFSRTGRAELQKTDLDLGQLVTEALSDFPQQITSNRILWQIHQLPSVWADHALLRMVLVNLISNAVKFTSSIAHPRIEIGCTHGQANETTIFIRDNGAGFNQQNAGRLFGVFQRLHADSEFEGTGIGLANVQRIIHRHGGRIWAQGITNGGATFYFSIPRNPQRVACEVTEKVEVNRIIADSI